MVVSPTPSCQRLSGRDLRNQIMGIGIIERDIRIEDDLAQHRAMSADMLGEQARIFDFQGGNFFLLQPRTQIHRALRMRGQVNIVGNNQSGHVDFVIFPESLVRYAIIADDGIGHGQNLARKGGIGQGFRIANHTRAKDDLASSFSP